MDLRKLISDLTTADGRNISTIQAIIKKNPDLLQNLDGYEAKWLLRNTFRKRCFLFQVELSKFIDEFKINVNPLEKALFQGDLKLIENLLRNGSGLIGEEWLFFSPAEYVFRQPNISLRRDLLLLLLKYDLHSSFKYAGENGLVLLSQMVEKDDLDAVELAEILINSGISISEHHNDTTPFHSAIEHGKIHLVSYFLKKGANIHQRGTLKRTPLILAALEGHEDIVSLLLANGADIHEKDKLLGETALHFACHRNCEKVIGLLIRNGADVTTQGELFRKLKGTDASPIMVLDPKLKNYEGCLSTVIREFSKIRFENTSATEKGMNLMMANSKTSKLFEKCMTELNQMANTKLWAEFSYYSILNEKIPMKKLALLTKNDELLAEIETTLRGFPNYQNDLRRILTEAVWVKNRLVDVEFRLKYTFIHILPDVVIKNLRNYLIPEDLPLQ